MPPLDDAAVSEIARGEGAASNGANGNGNAEHAEHVIAAAVGQVPGLALEEDILAWFIADLRRAGVAGEETLAKLIYLAVTSRVLPWGAAHNRPVSVIPKGTSSSGKSHTTDTTLRFFPPNAYVDLGSMSKRYLLYMKEDLRHKFIYIPEADAIMGDDELISALRTLLSKGRLVHGTVDFQKKGDKAVAIEKEGPTGLIMTTTASAVDAELETRCLSLLTDDSREQTRRVFQALAALEDDEEDQPVSFESWHGLQRWIAEDGIHAVHIPYRAALAELMPTDATRLRRDFGAILSLIRSHAILHQATRERDERGRIVATLADYSVVRELISTVIAEGVDAGVSPHIRETVEAVGTLQDQGAEFITLNTLEAALPVGRSATDDRMKRALKSGWLRNVAPKHIRERRVVVGTPLPGDTRFLPTAEDLDSIRSTSGEAPDNAIPLGMPDPGTSSGNPVETAEEQTSLAVTDEARYCPDCNTQAACDEERRCRILEGEAAEHLDVDLGAFS